MGIATRAARRAPAGLTADWDMVAALRWQIHEVHGLLDERVSAAAERTRSTPAAERYVLSLYAHALCVEDTTVNLLLRQMPPLFKSMWTGGHIQPWTQATLRDYAKVVHTSTDFVLQRMTLADLRSSIDLSAAGLGQPDANWVLNRFVLWETAMICGELAPRPTELTRAGEAPRTYPMHAASQSR